MREKAGKGVRVLPNMIEQPLPRNEILFRVAFCLGVSETFQFLGVTFRINLSVFLQQKKMTWSKCTTVSESETPRLVSFATGSVLDVLFHFETF